MAMLHLRVVCTEALADEAHAVLADRTGVVAVLRSDGSSDGTVLDADLAREAVDDVLDDLRAVGVCDAGMITLGGIDTAIGGLADRAEDDAPGEGEDAVIWDELTDRLHEDSTLTWTFAGFMTLATLLAAIGVVTDSTVTVVGAMVIGPEFGPLAGLAIGLVRGARDIARRAAVALVAGFALAIVVVAVLSLVGRAGGLVSAAVLQGHRETEFIYHPGWFSLITALVAGTAGMLSIISSRSTALVGVFISVTTIPAAGNAAVAGAVGDWYEAGQSALQLLINLVGITAAAAFVLLLRRRTENTRATTHRAAGRTPRT